jgi:hypothetical protein
MPGLPMADRCFKADTHWPTPERLMAAKGQRLVRSVSAEGQSVSYESTPSTDKVPTAGVPPMSR